MTSKEELMKASAKYQFKNEAKDSGVILTLSGPIAKPSIFADETINSADIAEVLDDVDKDITIRLNSPGGDAFEGIEIYNYLKNHPSNITVEITALAASAASIIAMAADETVMGKGASIMVHEASTIAIGNKSEVKKTLNALETIDESIVDIYAEKTNLSRDEIVNLMEEETWFTAQKAVEKGFANRTKDVVKTPKESGNKQNSLNYQFDNDMKDALVNLTNEFASLKEKITTENRKKSKYL